MTHRIAGAVALVLALAWSSPASALTRLAAFAWTPASGPVAGYAVYAATGDSTEELVASVAVTNVVLAVESSEFVSVRVAAYDSAGRLGPASEASEAVRLCPGDFDGDETVGIMDWGDIQSCFSQAATGFCAGADLDGSGGMISFMDLQNVALGSDACPPSNCAGDFDNDGYIGINDVGQARNCLGLPGTGACLAADMDGNGAVSIFDLNYISTVMGQVACSI